MINIEEILIANGTTILTMVFLLFYRQNNKENIGLNANIFNWMAIINMLGALTETIGFMVDGKMFIASRGINYICNSVDFISSVTIGTLWCLYVEHFICGGNKKGIFHVGIVTIPWIIEIIAVLYNLFGTAFVFTISENNVYQRSSGSIIGYVMVFIYFIYSIYIVYHSKKQGDYTGFFPVLFFVGICFTGMFVQLFYYGITTAWLSIAIALIFMQIQSHTEILYVDELSGLYNRRYLNALFTDRNINRKSLYGIMMDINDFKHINDKWGHGAGDQAIRTIGSLLKEAVSDKGKTIRYAGDEFIVLLSEADEECVFFIMNEINNKLDQFNERVEKTYTLVWLWAMQN